MGLEFSIFSEPIFFKTKQGEQTWFTGLGAGTKAGERIGFIVQDHPFLGIGEQASVLIVALFAL